MITYHEIDGIPILIAEIWRLLFFLLAAGVTGRLVTMNLTRYTRDDGSRRWQWQWERKSFRWFHLSMIVTMLLLVILQIERFDDPVVIEGLPAHTIIVCLMGLGVVEYEQERTGSFHL